LVKKKGAKTKRKKRRNRKKKSLNGESLGLFIAPKSKY
jgi:hypothetical protein